jgi:hypothetical protein
MFEYRDPGLHTLKGFGAPIHVHQVLRSSEHGNRFEVRHQAAHRLCSGARRISTCSCGAGAGQKRRGLRGVSDRRGQDRQVKAHTRTPGAAGRRAAYADDLPLLPLPSTQHAPSDR